MWAPRRALWRAAQCDAFPRDSRGAGGANKLSHVMGQCVVGDCQAVVVLACWLLASALASGILWDL
eukprot:514899-Pyramimonas_sp.AAC.1